MKYEDLKYLLMEQVKSNYYLIELVVNSMSNEEYDNIPIAVLTPDQLEFIKAYAVTDVASREVDKMLNKTAYYDLYYVAPTLFKVRNENKK